MAIDPESPRGEPRPIGPSASPYGVTRMEAVVSLPGRMPSDSAGAILAPASGGGAAPKPAGGELDFEQWAAALAALLSTGVTFPFNVSAVGQQTTVNSTIA